MSGLGLLLALTLLRAHPLGPTWQAVPVLPTGHALPGRPGFGLGAKELVDIDHLWHWSANAGPERVAASAWRGKPPRQTGERLRMRVPGVSALKPLLGFFVVAAPRSMWLEVPEDFLPRWPVSSLGECSIPRSRGEPWRARLVGPTEGGWWAEIEPAAQEVLLARYLASQRTILMVNGLGQPAPGAVLQVLEPSRPEEGSLSKIAVFAAGPDGKVRLPSLPSQKTTSWLAGEPESLPWFFEGRPEDLPAVIELAAGTALSGRFVDAAGRDLARVSVRLEAWVAEAVPVPMARQAQSDPHGAWHLGGLPPGRVQIQAWRDGFAAYSEQIQLSGEALNLGDIRLERAAEVAFEVIDERGEPVSGAAVCMRGGAVASTNAAGQATLLDAPAQRPFTYTATAADHLSAEGSADARLSVPVVVELERAFVLNGRLVDSQGLPVAGGTLTLGSGAQSRREGLESDGSFRLALASARQMTLTLESPRSLPLVFELESGLAGEVRDLGDLVAPTGAAVTGRLLHRGGGEAVAGGRIWLPRPGPGGPAVAWVHRDLVAAASDASGWFRLEGLSAGLGGVLRIEAPGLARKHLVLPPLAEEEAHDLGEILLEEGSAVEVSLDEAAEPPALASTAVARLDLRGEGLEQDSLTLPMLQGRATFRNVPSGSFSLEVTNERTVLCQLGIEVPPDATQVQVECPSRPMRVHGAVQIAGEPASGGVLLWQPPPEAHPQSIARYRLPSGLSNTRVSAGLRPQPSVEVGPDGHFSTPDLYPGPWQVLYYPQPGEPAAAQRVELPRRSEHWVTLSYAGRSLQGWVANAAGDPVAEARVEELTTGLTTFSLADGAFQFHGLGVGAYALEARAMVGSAELRSDLTRFSVEADRPTAPVRLTLQRESEATLSIEVRGREGLPAAAQLVFVELEGRGLEVLTSDDAGLVRVTLPAPRAPRVRAAALVAGSWVLGEWVSLDSALGAGLKLAPTGRSQLRVRTEGEAGSPRILTASGWALDRLLTWLGLRPWLSAEDSLTLTGLPGGAYSVALGLAHSSVALQDEETREVLLRVPGGH